MITKSGSPRANAFSYSRYFRIENHARRWGLYVTTCGECRTKPFMPYPPLEHPFTYNFNWQHGRRLKDCQIVYISEGAGVLETESSAHRIGAGDAMLLTPGVWHRYKPEEATGWHEYWVGFDGSVARQILNARFFTKKNVVIPVREERAVLENFHQLFLAEQEAKPGMQQKLGALTGVLLSLLYTSTQPLAAKMESSAQMIEKTRQLLLDEKTRDMSLVDIAKSFNVSYSALRRAFREHTGMSLHQHRLHLKISSARELLRSTDLRVKEISYRCGFEDEQYFCRLFKLHTGITPTEFRQQCAPPDTVRHLPASSPTFRPESSGKL